MKTQTDTTLVSTQFDSLPLPNKSATLQSYTTTVLQKSNIAKDHLKKNNTLKKFKNIVPAGTISVGYDYGFLPYTLNSPAPSTAFKAEGQIAFDILNIPVDVIYFYTDQKNLIGLKNYFRISFNADRYKQMLDQRNYASSLAYQDQLKDLYSQRQTLSQKMAFQQYLTQMPKEKWPKYNATSKPTITKPDSVLLDTSYQISNSDLNANSLGYTSPTYNQDSAKASYLKYKHTYDSINEAIGELKSKMEWMQGGADYQNKNYPKYPSEKTNFLRGLKKLDIGLCYPAYSTFLAANVPVRGLNLEYENKNQFIGFTYGTTVSTLLNTNSVEGYLENLRNTVSYFDFNNLSNGRKIVSLKLGVGSKTGNHFFIGGLYGKGKNTYYNLSENASVNISAQGNIVLEADGRYKLTKNITIDAVLGKSSLNSGSFTNEELQRSFKEIFSGYRSYALLLSTNYKIQATKSNLTLSFRWIDPYFKSFGIGFLRSDNLRYELKFDQPLGKIFKYTCMLRRQEDNLLQLQNYKNTFVSLNNNLSIKAARKLLLRLSYTPLLRTLKYASTEIKNFSSIYTGVLSYSPRIKKTFTQFNLLYNYYIIASDTQKIDFQNISYSHQFTFKKGISTGFNASWFKNNLGQNNNDVWMGVLDLGFKFLDANQITVAAKAAYKNKGTVEPGFILRSNIKLFRTLFWEAQFEKFIVGDLFNSYDMENLKRFPYYCSTRLILNF